MSKHLNERLQNPSLKRSSYHGNGERVYEILHCEIGAFLAPVGATSCLKCCFCSFIYYLAQPSLLFQVIFPKKVRFSVIFPTVCLSCNDQQFLKHGHDPRRKFNCASLKIRGKKLANIDGIHDLCLTCRHKQKLCKVFSESAPTAQLACTQTFNTLCLPSVIRRSGEC